MKELIDLVAACPTNLKCCDFHHAKADQHGHGEVCKPMDRYYAALEQAQHHIEERRKKKMAKEMGDNIKLPPLHYDELPEPGDAIPAMRAYARKAIKADRQKRIEPVAWIVPDFGFLFPSKDAAERYLSNVGDARKPTPVYAAPQSAAPKFGEEE